GDVRAASGAGPRGRDHHHDLPPGFLAKATRQLTQRSPGDLLMELRELAANRRLTIWSERRKRGEGVGQAPRRFERHDRFSGAQDTLELTGSARQKPLEAPPAAREPGG